MGIRLYYTSKLRPNDASVLSVGLEPNWRHIIPPGQPEVVSRGHCIGECTRDTVPKNGVTIFAVALHAHLIGTKMQLRHVRNGTELPPLAEDENYDPAFQEFRILSEKRFLLPVSTNSEWKKFILGNNLLKSDLWSPFRSARLC